MGPALSSLLGRRGAFLIEAPSRLPTSPTGSSAVAIMPPLISRAKEAVSFEVATPVVIVFGATWGAFTPAG